MRHLLISTAILLAGPALADRIKTTARVTDVTVYPWGAGVTREAALDLPAGSHELVIPGIPEGIDPASLRITAEGAVIGATGVQQERALPETPAKSPELQSAQDEVRRLQTALAKHDASVAEIKARAEAADDTIEFLMKLATSDVTGSGDIAALTSAVAEQLLQARQTAVRARLEAETADVGREELVEDLARAEARLDALRGPETERGALVIAVQGQGQPARIRITNLTDQASWSPVYDLSLQRREGKLRLDRGLLVRQYTGEDWRGVHLVLSTARPMDQSAPSELQPDFLRIGDPQAKLYSRSTDSMAEAAMDSVERAAPAPASIAGSAVAGMVGETVVYDYPTPIDMRDGADALRLPLDSHELTPEIIAEAVPRRDDSAFLVADTVNSTGAVILPGDATFYADGAMVGRGVLELTAAGDDMKLGFGPLTGIKLERHIPDEIEGNRGLISKSSERRETAILRIRNLTGEEWPLRVIDRVPVSTQENLRVDWSADPRPDETDPDGKRGLLVWNGKIDAGEERSIALTTALRWPDGQILIGGE
ncbi:mucoidy inhibitor MuiA family protein [Paracoccus methylovorus]|uniref:Mucoidy inhibitor MuiA family protein n=1 Tax=Paracoccus methylovorus TaxID=2812658 RepID=A0ABX7JIM8_9RHOB|nr:MULTISPECIES: mucoidy inhibitor MuiA family protein [Paracoccus]QRZ13113.1 mucoidy inhibitor MuiA family protein [Paracoccus methylovorus]